MDTVKTVEVVYIQTLHPFYGTIVTVYWRTSRFMYRIRGSVIVMVTLVERSIYVYPICLNRECTHIPIINFITRLPHPTKVIITITEPPIRYLKWDIHQYMVTIIPQNWRRVWIYITSTVLTVSIIFINSADKSRKTYVIQLRTQSSIGCKEKKKLVMKHRHKLR